MEKNSLLAGVEFAALIAMLGMLRGAMAQHQSASMLGMLRGAMAQHQSASMLGMLRGAMAQHQSASPGATPEPEAGMICSALEVKTAERVGAALVVFHQANKSDGPRLGELLRQNDGVSVEFQTSDGHAHTGTVFRLGTCFGRGLLVFPAGSAQVSRGEQFRLKFPKGT